MYRNKAVRDRGAAVAFACTAARACGAALACAAAFGCTAESTRVALETQRRADDVAEAVFDRQHEALCVLLFRDTVVRLGAGGPALGDVQKAVLEQAWNDRDLVEFWRVQHERAKALRIVGVDTKLYGDQSVVDLLIKSLETKADRARQGLTSRAAEAAVADGN